ncbi:SREBP regulating gene protein isoform X2 [Athalia rosae]|uniref:SREBP regulating gene protein isoform X2 n=1 Tax=Athalia rosae TaxID=37344 RepID=UPI000A0EE374|nr:SREBP regulating gene protein isoform X2 [Athalia rosae]
MPAWTAVIRLLRRRIVLGVIFAVSFTYCALSLIQHEKRAALVENDSDDDQLYFSTDKPYLWQMQALSEEGDEDRDQDTALTLNNSDPLRNNCRNSIQGKALIVDERGLVCTRSEVLPSGCCSTEVLTLLNGNPNQSEAPTPLSVKRERYSCLTCNAEGCCAIFEYCVSCCLHPGRAASNKVAKDPEKKSGHDQNRRLKRTEEGGRAEANAMRHRLRTLDRFQVCLATCRTSSASVRHENTYKDPHSKYCYNLLSQNVNHNQRSRRDLNHIVTINNNNSQRKAALPPFSSFHI